eukprot:TRINITY_DN2511_c0_g1_i10.p1 TRINITY_DN2511_c0_g1~~TRINITY_DN2511_c0_g1_i10.p1  ORF type:complete len:103 (-),score=1.79 TRINITY_DN2511_c0_g1_i10:417-725(-)
MKIFPSFSASVFSTFPASIRHPLPAKQHECTLCRGKPLVSLELKCGMFFFFALQPPFPPFPFHIFCLNLMVVLCVVSTPNVCFCYFRLDVFADTSAIVFSHF